MPGLLADDGYIYQRKIVIYFLLDHILRKDLAECHIELKCIANSDEDQTFSVDFFIKTNNSKKKFYEVKKQQSLHYKSSLAPIIDYLYQIYTANPEEDTEFYLIHTCQIRGDYFIKFDSSRAEKNAAIHKFNTIYNEDFCDRFFPQQILDSIDSNLLCSDIELRTIGIIDKILKEYNIFNYGAGEQIYQSIRLCFENLESQEADRLKRRIISQFGIGFPVKSSMMVSVFALLNHNHSFFDKISSGFPKRSEAINDFYSKFSIPPVFTPPTQI